ncbi:NAD(P)-binding protein [Chitinibacteraceae bacterium HSL-7]
MAGWSRRGVLALGAAGALGGLAGCQRLATLGLNLQGHWPGMHEGHLLRQRNHLPEPTAERRTGIVIAGSGVAGLFAAWTLARAGRHDFIVIDGPEFGGNCAAGRAGALRYPQGAHYLPLPTLESGHVRELLADMGVIESGSHAIKPSYDERILIHSPQERLFIGGRWQDGVLPHSGISADEIAQQQRFFRHMATLQQTRGADGKRVFAIPLAFSSTDPAYTALDALPFARWLDQHGYTAPSLRWYLDYACRDDYGAGTARVSAWAGLHYFAARSGQAANGDEHAVLTWPDGLNPLIRHMASHVPAGQRVRGLASRIGERAGSAWVDVYDPLHQRTTRVHAETVICAMPLHVARHVVEDIAGYGFDATRHTLPHAAWQVSNFVFDRFPLEHDGAPLSWDNVVYGSASLGFVNATHQLIRQARPGLGVFTAYHAFDDDPAVVRQRLQHASTDTLFETASTDIDTVYNWRWRPHLRHVEMTVRGHAMSTPAPGFLANAGLAALRACDGRIRFAHADLSGLSIFEEAAYWGGRSTRGLV